jgi:hypothetical protein
VTCVYCHEDFAGTPTACPNCGLPTSDPGAPGRNSHSILDRTLSWSRTSFAGFFDRLRHSPGGIWTIPLAVGLVAGLFLGLGYAMGRGGEQPVAQNPEPTTSASTPVAQAAPVQTASASLPVEAVTPVITQAFNPTDEEPLPPRPAITQATVREGDGVDYFAEPKTVKPQRARKPRLQYPNWAKYETTRTSLPPPHVLAMNPYRERSPIYVYMMGIEHPYLSEVSTVWEKDGQFGPGPRLDFTGE